MRANWLTSHAAHSVPQPGFSIEPFRRPLSPHTQQRPGNRSIQAAAGDQLGLD